MFASRVTGPRPCLALRKARLSVLYSTSIHERDAAVNAFAYITDDVPDVGEGPLSGMNIAVKDNICTKTMPTTCSSAMLRGMSPLYFCTSLWLLISLCCCTRVLAANKRHRSAVTCRFWRKNPWKDEL